MVERQTDRMPSCLFDTYLNYKQDTRAIIGWLIKHGAPQQGRSESLTVKEISTLAESIRIKAIKLPDIIHFHFRQAIKARGLLSKFFRKASYQEEDDQSTCDHEFFTATLEKIYADLCECCGKAKCEYDRVSLSHSLKTDGSTAISNRFSSLQIECIEIHDPDQVETVETHHRPGSNEFKYRTVVESPTVPDLVGDTLHEIFALRYAIEDMYDLHTVVTETWERAGQGKTPFPVAVAMSFAAFTSFDDVAKRLKTLCDVSDPAALEEKIRCMKTTLKVSISPAMVDIALSLGEIWRELRSFKARGQKEITEEAPSSPSSPRVLQIDPSSASHDEDCIALLSYDMARHMFGPTAQTQLFYEAVSPIWTVFRHFLTFDTSESASLSCAFGFKLLLTSLKSGASAIKPTIRPSTCRIQALRFVQEAIPYIKAVLAGPTMPCRCKDTLALYLEIFLANLESFLGAKEFGVYFQTPWVSGSHILMVGQILFNYGLRLFSYKNIMGSVLHVYNALRNFDSIKMIPLFDNVIDSMKDVLFPGGRPSRNFTSCYMRHIGGRLRFHSTKHDTGCHSMVISPHSAKATAGFQVPEAKDDPRFDFKKTSFLFYMNHQRYQFNGSSWSQILNTANDKAVASNENAKNNSCTQCRNARAGLPSCPRGRLETLRDALTTDVNQPFCTARINFFKLYLSCLRIVTRMMNEYHEKDAPPPGSPCVCFADNLLTAADRSRSSAKRFEKLGCQKLLEICRRAMEEEVGEAEPQDFLWREF